MAVLSTEPDVVDIRAYAGDTLTIRVDILSGDPAGFVGGRIWSAQIRSAWDSPTTDAVFDVDPDATGCTLVLPADQTAALVGMIRTVPGQLTIVQGKYVGVWDAQLAPEGGGDPTTTVCRGQATFTGDVTRD